MKKMSISDGTNPKSLVSENIKTTGSGTLKDGCPSGRRPEDPLGRFDSADGFFTLRKDLLRISLRIEGFFRNIVSHTDGQLHCPKTICSDFIVLRRHSYYVTVAYVDMSNET